MGIVSALHDPVPAVVDWIVVGGGAAGCVLANRLSEDADATVLLIEAGPSHRGPSQQGDSPHGIEAIDDATAWTSLLGGEYDWGLAYAPTDRVDQRTLPIPRGRVLGGSSSINALLWYRGNPRDYDAWEAAGASGWNWATMLPYFRATEDWEGGANAWRGAGGPMRIERSHDPHPVALTLLDAADEHGIPVIDDPNAPDNLGAGLSNFTAHTGADGRMRRWSAARGYLDPVAQRPKLRVVTDAQVVRVTLEGGRASGVEGVVGGRGGAAFAVRAERGVVLTAGAIHTPAIMWHSGIGDADELRSVGIAASVDLPGVGRNYQDHPLLQGMSFSSRVPLGPMRDNGGGSMINWCSSVSDGRPDLHAFVAQAAQGTDAVRAAYDLGDGPAFAVSPGLMGSRSVGFVRLRSDDPFEAPEIQPNFYAEPDDLTAVVDAMEDVFALLETRAFEPICAGPLAPTRLRSDADKRAYIRMSTETFFHCSGTAAMGTGEDAVVDPQLRVRGVEGLWVADASVMPVIPTCNTLAPTLAIAERAASLIDGRARDPETMETV